VKHVFGPVPSRRLGRSLGVDPIPFKTCNRNCVYCQLGYTAPLTCERKEYVPEDEIMAEIREALRTETPDWITFVGSGEPTLHSGIGRMLRAVKAFSGIPVAVITNGSLLYRPEVRGELSVADAVLPTLDAGSEDLYLRIDRPHPEFTFERLVEGLAAFRKEYRGKLWVEVMLVEGVNDSDEALADLARVLERVEPDEVHVNLPVRPPAVPWAHPANREGVDRAVSVLGAVARVVAPGTGTFERSHAGDPVEAILGIIQRHPLSEDDARLALREWGVGDVDAVLGILGGDPRLQLVPRGDRKFWCFAEGAYLPDS